jgi:hypothetical protein
MKKTFGDYRLLAGSAGKGSLWAGPDHLLYVEASGFLLPFKEHYRRIDYKNIHALTLGRTSWAAWINLCLATLLSILAWGVADNYQSERNTAISFACAALPLLIIFIVNLVRGSTCICKLQTAVQVLRLKPLGRLRKAQACIKAVRKPSPSAGPPPPLSTPASASLASRPSPSTPAPPSSSGRSSPCSSLGSWALPMSSCNPSRST